MFTKTTLVFALLAAFAQVAVTQAVVQPACFMKVFSSFQTASPGHYAADQKTLCCKEAAEFKSRIHSDLCPSGDQAAALSSYKTASVVTSGVAGATGFATGTGASGPFATGAGGSGSGSASGSGSGSGLASGSPITPVSPSKTGTGPRFTGAATRNIGSVAVGLLAVAGIAMAL
ncbi:MAG: hypothetical protein ALECFALPRED_001176 [Alectoria fallacina]|uniref:Uncharacterized protein n=1 Tax=Alectoria fallacina TaxID=1903189 RepID=A0A8H3I955_9LECA|nr:MAG: hypothetical protein ALECFALPRED_001176 [Alectoria fallacina]